MEDSESQSLSSLERAEREYFPDHERLQRQQTNTNGSTLDRQLSRVEQLALEYVDLDFAVQEQAIEHLKRIGAGSSDFSRPLQLHVSPFEWSLMRKTKALLFPCFAALLAGYAAGAYAFAGDDLKAAWGLSQVAYNLGITLFVLGFGVAPVVLALLSEIYGRYWIFVSCGLVFFLGTMGCALTSSFAGMLVSRFITGSGASVFATLSAGVVSDLFPNAQRNTPMALYSLCLCAGTGVGPLVSGAIIQSGLGWRWIFYLQMIVIAATTLAVAFVFEETRANVLLGHNSKKLNLHIDLLEKSGLSGPSHEHLFPPHHPNSHHIQHDHEKDQQQHQHQHIRFRVSDPSRNADDSLLQMVWHSLRFPLQLLATEPIVFWFSAWVSFAWAILYMQFSSIPRVYAGVYGFDNLRVGLVYIAIIAGCIAGCVISIVQDKVLRKFWPERAAKPEGRLYFACGGSVALPVGLFWFGWAAQSGGSVHWAVPTVAIGVFVAGIFVIYLAVFNFLADSYARFASSAQAAQSMCRNLLAGVFPLFANAMFDTLGYGGGESLLGGIGILLCLVPWLLCMYGPAIRSRSAFAQTLEKN